MDPNHRALQANVSEEGFDAHQFTLCVVDRNYQVKSDGKTCERLRGRPHFGQVAEFGESGKVADMPKFAVRKRWRQECAGVDPFGGAQSSNVGTERCRLR